MSLIERIFPHTSLDDFLSKYWLYQPLHAKGALSRLPEIANNPVFATLDTALAMECFSRRVDMPAQDGSNLVQQNFRASVDDARQAVAAGQTVYMGGLRAMPLPQFSDQLSAELDLPLALEGLYLERYWLAFAAKPSKGLRWHWDKHHLLIIQVRGRKKFLIARNQFFSRPSVPPEGYDSWLEGMTPTLSGALGRTAMTEVDLPSDFMEIELGPGDALFMPAGLWHSAETVEDSLHIGYAVKLPTLPELMHSQLILMNEAFDRKFHVPIASAKDFVSLCHSDDLSDAPIQLARRAWFNAMAETMNKYAHGDTYARFLQKAVADLEGGAFSRAPKK